MLSSGRHRISALSEEVIPDSRPEAERTGAGERGLPKSVHQTGVLNQRGLSGSVDHYLTIFRSSAYRAAGVP